MTAFGPVRAGRSAVLTTLDLPLAELCGARLDGELYRLGEAYCAIDEVDSWRTRALSLRSILPRQGCIERMSAAWVYGVVAEPARHEFCVDPRSRVHLVPSLRVVIREVSCPPAGIREYGGVRVKTPLSTVVDLARWVPPADDPVAVLVALLRYDGQGDTAAARLLCAPRLPYRSQALRRLDAVDERLAAAPR